MAYLCDSSSEVITEVTCEGDLLDPRFPAQLELVIRRLNEKLGDKVKIQKLEPWNSVRVTLSIPREAALQLRHLAIESSQELRALGILSVQVEGDQVISVNSEPQDIILDTSQDGNSNGGTTMRDETSVRSPTTVSTQSSSEIDSAQLQFKSPNVVCPSDSVVPRVSPSSTTPSVINSNSKMLSAPFPFTSMNQAIQGGNRESSLNSLPPPYPGKHPPMTISSPLLVNLLQNDVTKESSNLKGSQQPLNVIRTLTTISQKVYNMSATSLVSTTTSFTKLNKSINSQANIVVSHSVSPSAFSSTNVVIKKHGTSSVITTNHKTAVKSPPCLPAEHHRELSTTMVSKPMHTSAFMECQPHCLANSSSQSVTVTQQPAVQPQGLLKMPQSQNTSTTRVNRIPASDTISVVKNSKILQEKTSNLTNFLPGRNSLSLALPPRRIFNISSDNTNILPTTRMCSPKIESSQTKDGCYMFQQLKATKKSLIESSCNSSSIYSQVMVSAGTTSSTTSFSNTDTLYLNNSNLNNVMLRSLPSPPSYSVAISKTWESSVNNTLLDLTPTLTDLKPDELEELLPSLGLTKNPYPDLSNEFPNVNSNISTAEDLKMTPLQNRTFLINPLTGELEPQPSDESDHEELQDVFTGLESPASLSDGDTCSNSRFDPSTDQSDNEARANDKITKLKNSTKDRGRDSPSLRQEKIKLRLKLEKSEPVNSAYKVDVSYINNLSKKPTMVSSTCEELRVPPLHISLRGRNSIVIKNKTKLNSDSTAQKPKVKKSQEHSRIKKNDSPISLSKGNEIFECVTNSLISENSEQLKMHVTQKKIKKKRTDQDQREITSLAQESDLQPYFFVHKEKQKERRGSDSELVQNNKKYSDNYGVLFDEKKRRFSHTEHIEFDQPPIVGSTNVGTIANVPQKPRKDKMKLRDIFRKEANKIKNFCRIESDKIQHKVVSLPVASDMNMEAKFKQGLMEGNVKNMVSLPHRTEAETNQSESNEFTTVPSIPEDSKTKFLDPHSHRCDSIEMKSIELIEKSTSVQCARSPNAGGGQGEDSGIESMDALSEKSPNQASQSPYADNSKAQVPNILDIEAQLAKMEGLERETYGNDGNSANIPNEDVTGDKCHRDVGTESNECCELTYVLQEAMSSPLDSSSKQPEINFVAVKTEKEEEDLEPMPVRITPALYTYSNPEKVRFGLESLEGTSDDDSNSCSTTSTIQSKPGKSLLEQLLIEIPNDHQGIMHSSSPATRFSVRTRALTKLESPEINSTVSKNSRNVASGKRKRNESDSSNHSVEDNMKKTKKRIDIQKSDFSKTLYQSNPNKADNIRKDESSDSDEPLIEKMKKNINIQVSTLVTTKTKVKVGVENITNNNKGWMINTRRSIRSNISQTTKNKCEKIQSDSDALRRKTRSTVIDMEKRQKEVK